MFCDFILSLEVVESNAEVFDVLYFGALDRNNTENTREAAIAYNFLTENAPVPKMP
jgi:hypothetical protein